MLKESRLLTIKIMMLRRKIKLTEIPALKGIADIQPLKGLLDSQKYYVKRKNGQEMILVLYEDSVKSRLKEEMRWITFLEAQGIPTNRLLDFGTYNSGQGCYMILSWISGSDVQMLLRNESSKNCTLLGSKAGELLRTIHSLPIDSEISFRSSLHEEICDCINEFSANNALLKQYPAMETFLQFLYDNMHYLTGNSTPTFLHGDYHSKNIIFSGGDLSVIDWVYGTIGNPIEDFVRNVISAETSNFYAAALIDAYIKDCIPDDFWMTLAIYTAIHELRITKYNFLAPRLHNSFVKHQHNLILQQYRGMKTIIPLYYKK